jgi:mRNA-degrading endonuclease RelE of RelBE toxin-antitoxin system
MEVRLTPQALAEYKRLPFVIRSRVADLFQRMKAWPNVSGAKPMRREWKNHFRFRTGDWRVIVKPAGDVLWVVRIDNRRDVYGD